jgi:hypothetical protein
MGGAAAAAAQKQGGKKNLNAPMLQNKMLCSII